MKKNKLILVFGILYPFFLIGQEKQDTRERFQYHIKKIASPILIDGVESENEWKSHQLIDTLYNHNPSDKGIANYKSEIRLAYDDKNLYIFAKHYDDGHRIIQSLQRDSDNSQWDSDSFTIAIDPINKKQSGIIIGVNAGGAKVDGSLLVQPSRTTYTDSWDISWVSATKQYDDHWLLEIAIPFSSMRYNEDNTEWGINFIRGHKSKNFYYTWTPFPINFNGIDVNYMGTLKWPEVPKVKSKIALVKPYTTFRSLKDNELEDNSNKTELDVGVDLKTMVTKSLTFDATLNPDFSNADVDLEVTNITRFNIFLPERREFFIENGDIFTNFGSYTVTPFFSRRIGLAGGRTVPVAYGAKITGNITDDLRIGLMNVQTRKDIDLDAQNYTVAAFNYNVFGRSQIKGLFINRQETGNKEINDFNRNYGAEFSYVSKSGNFNGTAMFHSTVDENGLSGNYLGTNGSYIDRNFGVGWGIDKVDKSYQSDLGISPRVFNYNADTEETIRLGYTSMTPWWRYRIFPKNSKSIVFHGPRVQHGLYLNDDYKIYEQFHRFSYDFDFKNRSLFTASTSFNSVSLQFPTNFLGNTFTNLPAIKYNYWNGSIFYFSDRRKQFTYSLDANYGEFYNGKRASISASGNLRFGYWGNFGVTYTFNDIKLPENYGEVDLHLFRFSGRISFTNKLFFNNTVQYNSQSTNFSVFSRLQWRYAPLSDLFVIYNQNNNTEGFNLRNRSIMLKLTHRFSL